MKAFKGIALAGVFGTAMLLAQSWRGLAEDSS